MKKQQQLEAFWTEILDRVEAAKGRRFLTPRQADRFFKALEEAKRQVKKSVPATCAKRHNPVPTSRCAGKCRHVWCNGYDAGYSDGQDDSIADRDRRS